MLLTFDQWIRLNNQTSGKDKIIRLIQYLSRFLWYYLGKRWDLRDTVSRLKILENALSTFRKLLRFGKCIEVLNGALATLKLSDRFLQVTITMSRIYQSFYLLLDHFIWLSRVGLLDMDKERINANACRFWLGAVIFSLIRDCYEISLIIKRKSCQMVKCNYPCVFKYNSLTNSIYELIPQSRPLFLFIENHPDVFWDTLKNSCDIWIPLTQLGKTNLSPGLIGLLGTISSFAAIVTLLNPLAKLAPV